MLESIIGKGNYMAAKQESVSDWMALAKAYDKTEKEQGVTPYIVVSLRNRRTDEELYRYDLPRELYWRYSWVIDWRAARLLCQHPQDGINHVMSFYDKRTGLEYGFGSLISKLTSAKAKVTMAANKLQKYIELQQSNMFFDEKGDEVVNKLKAKIAAYKEKAAEVEKLIKERVEELQRNNK